MPDSPTQPSAGEPPAVAPPAAGEPPAVEAPAAEAPVAEAPDAEVPVAEAQPLTGAAASAPATAGAQPLAGEAPNAAFLLSALGRIVREEIEGELREAGLSLRHLSALGHLSRAPGLSYSELGRRAGVTAQSMQATLRQLEDAGAVDRTTPAGRGRTAELHLSATGRRLLARGREVVQAVDDRLLDTFAAEDKRQLSALLLRAFSAVAARRRPG